MQAMQVGKMYINVYTQDLNDKESIFTKSKAHSFQNQWQLCAKALAELFIKFFVPGTKLGLKTKLTTFKGDFFETCMYSGIPITEELLILHLFLS